MKLTKTDFIAYLDAPRHLWTIKNNKIPDQEINAYVQHLFDQGYDVEQYEEIIVMSRYWLREKPHVKKYCVKKLLISNKLSLTSILKFNNIHRKDILKLNSAKDVDELFTEHKSS